MTTTPTPPARMGAGLTVTAAAQRLGVTASTLRSWERRYGLAPSARTDGGHRRYTAQDLVVLQRVCALTAAGVGTGEAARASARAPATRAGGVGPGLVARFAAATEAVDVSGALACAERAIARHGPARAWTDVFAPVLRELGERWQLSGTGIEREHVASTAVEQAFIAFTRRHAPARGPVVLLGVAAAGEGHLLPLHALSAAAAADGVASAVLTALPRAALSEAVDALRPATTVVWSHAAQTADTRLLRGLPDRVPAVYVGGPGWKRRRLPDQITALPDLAAAVAAVRMWNA